MQGCSLGHSESGGIPLLELKWPKNQLLGAADGYWIRPGPGAKHLCFGECGALSAAPALAHELRITEESDHFWGVFQETHQTFHTHCPLASFLSLEHTTIKKKKKVTPRNDLKVLSGYFAKKIEESTVRRKEEKMFTEFSPA